MCYVKCLDRSKRTKQANASKRRRKIKMKIDEILDLMDELLDKAVTVPFTNKKTLVDTEKLREYIDSMRYNIPSDIQKAKEIQNDKAIIMTEANKKAEVIIKKAEDRAKVLVSNEEILKQAKEQAAEITAQAYAMDRDIRNAMSEKIDNMLASAEESITSTLNDIKNTRVAVKAANSPKNKAQ